MAGSERADKSGTLDDNKQLKETQNINLSLTTLGKIINQIASNIPGAVVSYRESALTKILKSSLSGNSKTTLVCTMSRKEINEAETWSTLQFAKRATNIKLKATINKKLTAEQLEKFIIKLNNEIKAYKDVLGEDAETILQEYTGYDEIALESEIKPMQRRSTVLRTFEKLKMLEEV